MRSTTWAMLASVLVAFPMASHGGPGSGSPELASAGTVVRWRTALEGGSEAEQEKVIDAIQESQEGLREMLPSLMATILKSDKEELRAKATGAARTIGWRNASEDVVDGLIDALRYGTRLQKIRALMILEEMGPKGRPAAPHLRYMLRSEDEHVIGASSVLGSIGDRSAIPELLSFCKSHRDVPVARGEAVLALARLGARQIIPLLTRDLRSQSPVLRCFAAMALAELGALPPPTVKALAEVCRDKDARVRTNALRAIAGSGQVDKSTLGVISRGLDDTEPGVQKAAVAAALAMRIHSEDVIAKLFRKCDSNIPSVAIAAAPALEGIGRPAVGFLSLTLRSGSIQQRALAADLLARIPPDGLRALAAAAASGEFRAAIAAVRGMGAADPTKEAEEAFMPVLLRMLSERSFHVQCMEVIESLKLSSPDVIKALSVILLDEGEPVLNRTLAVDVLAGFAKSAAARTALEKAAKSGNADVAKAAAEALKSAQKKQ